MTDEDPQERPARPVLVEAAAAILLVGGILGIAAWRAALPTEARPVR